MFLAVASVFAACSDDDSSWNTAADVTVNMKPIENKNPEDDTLRVKENVGIFNVPIVVAGTTNGPVKVNVSVKETGTNPAKKDVNYLVTDTTIVITEGKGNVEIKAVDDDDINEARTFDVTIVSAEGAKLGNHLTTPVKLRDNDSEFYDKLQGTYTMTSVGFRGAQSWTVTIKGDGEDDVDDYNGHYLYVYGMMGYSFTTAVLTYNYDNATKAGSVTFGNLGQYNFAEGLDFGTGDTNMSVRLLNLNGTSLSNTPISGTWSADFKTITFTPSATLCGAIYTSGGQFSGSAWFSAAKMVLTKK